MDLYYVSFIHIESNGKPVLVALSDSIIGLDKAIKEIEWQRENRKVISAWVDTFDEQGTKHTVLHQCYIDCFGEIQPLKKETKTIGQHDSELEELWIRFEDIPMNPIMECIEEPFLHFPAGTFREDIWHWFDERHSKGVVYLLYGKEYGDGK